MSQYNAQPDSTAENAGWEASAPELTPFLPTTDQSGGWNPPARTGAGQLVTSKATLPPNVESMSLHAKTGFIGRTGHSCVHANLSHTCIACSTSFPNNYQLERHATKNKHKAYLCTCGKGFTKLSALRRHFEESTEARGHQCPLCASEFKRPGHVEQHLRLVHKKQNDVIKDLLSTQKSQPPREPKQASTASTTVPTTGSMDSQAGHPIANPGGSWTGPIDFSAPAPADYPSSRPVRSSAFSDFSAPGPGHTTEAPGFAPQSFMTQAPVLPIYPTYPAGAVAAQTGFPAHPVPDFVGFPAAYSDGNLDLSNVDPALISGNSVDGLEMPALGNDLMWELFGSDFNTLDL